MQLRRSNRLAGLPPGYEMQNKKYGIFEYIAFLLTVYMMVVAFLSSVKGYWQ
jgi:hypothetical protein